LQISHDNPGRGSRLRAFEKEQTKGEKIRTKERKLKGRGKEEEEEEEGRNATPFRICGINERGSA